MDINGQMKDGQWDRGKEVMEALYAAIRVVAVKTRLPMLPLDLYGIMRLNITLLSGITENLCRQK